MQKRGIKIIGTGKYLPSRIVKGEEVDRVLGLAPGSSESMSGIAQRRYITDETNSKMGALALMGAIENAHIRYEDLDAIICASGTMEQAIPCTAALIQRELNQSKSGTPCFDINSTCLSFVTAYDLAASLLESNRYQRIAIVSSEIASPGLNKKQHEAYSLFGDGAAAVVVEKPASHESSGVIHAHMKTFSEGAEFCRITGGGIKLHPKDHYYPGNEEKWLFAMEGRKVFKLVLETIPEFFSDLLRDSNTKVDDIKLVIPHQASASGMELVRRKLGISKENYMDDILANHGNMIAASIPLALHTAIEEGRIKRGDQVLLLGTSAGMSLGAVLLEY